MLKREQYLSQVRSFMNRPVVKVLIGMRRCGKSVLLDQIREEILSTGIPAANTMLINFESRTHDYGDSLDKAYEAVKSHAGIIKGKLYLFLDEIQELSGWEKLVNSLMVDFDTDIYLTGSNAQLLSGELATYLAGRYVTFHVYPFSFSEMVRQKKEMGLDVDLHAAFQQYVVMGGMPFLHHQQMEGRSANQYLTDIYNSIILKDIAQRYRVRDIDLMQRLIEFMLMNAGNTFSATSVLRYLKNEKRTLSTETMYNYIGYCRQACLLELVSRDDIVGKRVLQYQEKIYLTDHGIREAVFHRNEQDIQQVLENIVYMELLRRGYDVCVGKMDTGEVDFVARRQAERVYVQVCYLLASEDTVEREFSVLERIPDNYPKLVISMDPIRRGRNGILHQHIVDFLMEQWEG